MSAENSGFTKRRGLGGFFIVIVLGTFLMGSSFPTGKFLIAVEEVPPFGLAAWRFIVAGLLVLSYQLIRYGPETVMPLSGNSVLRGFLVVGLIGSLQTAGAMGFLNLALQRVDASLAAVLFFTNPLWVLLMAHSFGFDLITRKRLVGLLMGMVGVAVCMDITGGGSLIGFTFALCGALCWAVCTIVTSKVVTYQRSTFSLTGWQMLLGGLMLLAVSTGLGESYQPSAISGWGLFNFIWLSIPASVGSFGLWFLALSRLGPAVASPFLFLAPLFGSLLSVSFLGDPLGISFVIGGLLIVASLFIVNR